MRVLIVGGGTAGWMTAAALSRLLPPGRVDIQLVESEAIGTIGVGEATVPHIRFFNAKLGFDEADFMARTKATFKLGIEFRNWGRKGDAYIHPFGAFGDDLGGVPFHQQWLRARQAGSDTGIEDFSFPIVAARRGKFSHPAEDPKSPLSTFSYAYQFDATLYAAYLREFAGQHGVKRIEGRVVDVKQNAQSGFVESLSLESGEKLEAELFIDCSGLRGLLIEQTLKTGYDEWGHWLPCDRAYAVPCDTSGPLTPYTRATAQDAGWIWRIPLQHRVGNGHVYSSAFCSDEQAERVLLEQLESPPTSDPFKLCYTTGKRRKQWSKNVVAIGLSSGFLEPLESTSIHLIQLAIGYLVDFFPDRDFNPMNEIEFNRLTALEYERIRDFLILHYHATERDDSEFWNYCRTMSIPDSLQHKYDVWNSQGRFFRFDEELFTTPSWVQVFLGQRVVPKDCHGIAKLLTADDTKDYLKRVNGILKQAVSQLPTHREYINQTCAFREMS